MCLTSSSSGLVSGHLPFLPLVLGEQVPSLSGPPCPVSTLVVVPSTGPPGPQLPMLSSAAQ